jgi:hypothetical protein
VNSTPLNSTKPVNSTPLNSTKPVNSNMSFGTEFAFPYDNVPLNSTSLQIALLFSLVPRTGAICRFHCVSAYTEIISPCTKRRARYKKYSPDALMPPSGSYFSSLLLTGISTHYFYVLVFHLAVNWLLLNAFDIYSLGFVCNLISAF